MIDAKRKAMIFLTLAFILAILTSALVLNEIRRVQMSLGERIRVAIAKENIQTYTEITPDMVEWVEIPNTTKFNSYIKNEDELKNSVLIVGVKQGDLLTNSMIRSKLDIPSSHRVVWLNATTNVVIDQEIAENDLVDIIAFYQDVKANTQITKRVLQSVPVVQRQEFDQGVAIKVSLSVEQAEQYIHLQNTASQIRVLRVNQVQTRNHTEAVHQPPQKISVQPQVKEKQPEGK